MSDPGFLDLPARTSKPRASGLTHVLDKGVAPADLERLLGRVGRHVDVWKFGWGTAYLDPDLPAKVRLLREAGVLSCAGGTLLEAAWVQGRVDEYLGWARAVGVSCVEVSNGVAEMSYGEKRRLIERASTDWVVVSEVGSKDPANVPDPDAWSREMASDLAAGATWVIAEGRESGTVGLYEPDGLIRVGLVEAVAAAVGAARVIFEAPDKSQQAWLINRFGTDANLGNVLPADVLGLEALRLGIRGDTIGWLPRPVTVATGRETAGGSTSG